MPEKVGLWKRIEKNKSLQILFFCVSMAVLFAVYTITVNIIYKDFIVLEDDFSWVYQIEEIEYKAGKMKLVGWAFELEENSKNNRYEMILRQIETDEVVYPKMKYQQRSDVNEYFECEYNYLNSGLVKFTTLVATTK